MTIETRGTEVTLVNEDSEVIKIREYSDDSSYAVITDISGDGLFSFQKRDASIIIDAINTICGKGDTRE